MDIHFFDASTGYALIDSNPYGNTKFFKTTDSGANWQFVHRIDNASVFGMHFFDMNTGFAYGFKNGGRIYRTTNAGVNWIVNNMDSQIDGITFLNSTTGIAIGVGENLGLTYIYKTTNAGLNWYVINTINGSKLFNNLKSLQNTGTAFAIGNNIDTGIQLIDKITTLKTTNYGLNWVSKEFNPKLLAYGLALVDANNFFMGAGEINIAAQILKSTNGGNVFVNQIGTVIPSAYLLSQNYPNPFNPTTKIQFEVPLCHSCEGRNPHVIIKVFDILGKEVQTLVNESLQPGTYETSFDGSSLNSGVYFYRLITNEFTETKKMLLIK